MNTLRVTIHAGRRLRQRSIPKEAIELLMEFGTITRSHGADRLFFDKKSRQRFKRQMGVEVVRRRERYMNAYAVVSDSGAVITAGYRTKRFQRH